MGDIFGRVANIILATIVVILIALIIISIFIFFFLTAFINPDLIGLAELLLSITFITSASVLIPTLLYILVCQFCFFIYYCIKGE